MLRFLFFAVVCFLFTGRSFQEESFVDGLPREDEVLYIPYYNGTAPPKLFSGYIQLPRSAKKLFYILVLSEGSPKDDPLVFWTNGGPGCSSMAGFMVEHGPFRMSSTGLGPEPAFLLESVTLTENPYSWSKVANMLYLDMPAGTGLSYSTDKKDYTTNDTQATQDTYEFLQAWFEKYSSFKSHDFYLSGESYAGIYIPLIAKLILAGNKKNSDDIKNINLKGYLIGNPSTDHTQNYRREDLYQGLSLIPESLFDEVEKAGCETDAPADTKNSGKCKKLNNEMFSRVGATFPYDVLVDCFYGMATYNRVLFELVKSGLENEGIKYRDPLYGTLDYCDYDDRETAFLLNNEEMRDALHIAPFADEKETLAGFFEICQGRVTYKRVTETTIPYHRSNIQAGLSVFIFSGDHDRVVPTMGTQKWTHDLGDELGGQVANFEPWWRLVPERFGWQIGGYISIWDGLSFATIRNAGHQVPTHKPAEMLELLTAYLAGNLEGLVAKPRSLLTIPSLQTLLHDVGQ